jgi:hypothetical protein
MTLDLAERWDRARSIAADLVAQEIPWAQPGDPDRDPGGVDCGGAVLRFLEGAGARFPSRRLWTVEDWALGQDSALGNAQEVTAASGWTLISGPCDALPENLEPFDVILSKEQSSPLHVSGVIEPRGARLLTAVKPVGLCVVRRRILGPILAVYRLEGLPR